MGGAETLPGSDLDLGGLGQRGVAVHVEGRQGLLQEVEVERLQKAGGSNGFLEIPAGGPIGRTAEVEHQARFRPDGLADGGQSLFVLGPKVVAPAILDGPEPPPDKGRAFRRQLLGGFQAGQGLSVQGVGIEGRAAGVGHDPALNRSPQQLVERLLQGFSGQVPESHVDGAHGIDGHAALASPPPEGLPVLEHAHPEAAGFQRVPAKQKAAQASPAVQYNGPDDPGGGAGDADSGQALVGFHLYEGQAGMAAATDTDVGDRHGFKLFYRPQERATWWVRCANCSGVSPRVPLATSKVQGPEYPTEASAWRMAGQSRPPWVGGQWLSAGWS